MSIRAARLLRQRELLQEERVAGAPLGDRGDLVLEQTFLGSRGDQRAGCFLRQRLEVDGHRRHRRDALGGHEPTGRGPPRRAEEPWLRADLCAQMAKQIRRRLVHPVDVLDHDQGRRVEQLREQRLDDAVQPGAPEGRLQLFDLGCRLDVDVEGQGQQRKPGKQLRIERCDTLAEDGRGGTVLRQLEQRPEQSPEGEVGRRELVLLARRRRDLHVGALGPELGDEA